MALKLVNVNICAGQKTLFKNFNLTVTKGSFCTLMGPSGSGKSSLLNFILGNINSPTFTCSGEIWLNDTLLNLLPIEKRQIGILFQDPALFPHLSVTENLAFGIPKLDYNGRVKSHREKVEKIKNVLNQAQLHGLENQNPETLSGGEKTRVGLLRTLLSEPRALLLDEPFSKLDQDLRQEFREWVFSMLREKFIPVILVTHDPTDAPPDCKMIELNHA